LFEGEGTVRPKGKKPINFSAGDLVTFPAGMNCIWNVHKALNLKITHFYSLTLPYHFQ
tara:strand:+ start:109 stop:282 length:174 start_codon:yes stop_codon:yes gene_type:complete